QGLFAPFHLFELTALAQVLLVPLVALHVTHVAFALRALRRGHPGAPPLVCAFAVWLGAAVLDSATALGWTHAPVLLGSSGHLLLVVITLSAVLVRDLVRAMDEHERLGARLQSLAHARADE